MCLLLGNTVKEGREVKIEIKQEHIDKGKMSDMYRCPLSIAVNEYFGDGKYSYTEGKHVTVYDGVFECSAGYDPIHKFVIPEELIDQINDFDQGVGPKLSLIHI